MHSPGHHSVDGLLVVISMMCLAASGNDVIQVTKYPRLQLSRVVRKTGSGQSYSSDDVLLDL